MKSRRKTRTPRGTSSADQRPVQTIWLCLALLIAVLLAYGPVLGHDFVYWDDDGHITENPHLASFSLANLARFWREPYFNHYVPLSYTMFAAEARLALSAPDENGQARFRPAVFHVGSLCLHSTCVLLVFALLLRILGDSHASAVGAALFALHPFQVESVAWISEQRGLLAAVFSLLAIMAWLRFGHGVPHSGTSQPYAHQLRAINAANGGWAWYALSTGAFVLALLAKPSAAAVPLIVATLDRLLLRRGWRNSLLLLMPWLAMTVAMLAITKQQQPDEALSFQTPVGFRLLIAGDALQFYLTRLVWPSGFMIQYPRAPQLVLAGSWAYFAWLVPAAVAIACVRSRTQGPWLACFGWLVASLAPVLGLIPFVYQHYSTVADRYMYLALFAPAWAAGWWLSRNYSRATLTVCLAVLVVLAGLSFRQTLTWRNSHTLFAHTLRLNPSSDAAQLGMGAEFLRREQYAQALQHIEEGLRLNPSTGSEKPHLNRGLALLRLGRVDEAIQAYEDVLVRFPQAYAAHLNLSAAYFQKSDWPQTIEHSRAGLQAEPNNVAARFNLALALDRQGNTPEAIQELRILLKHWPRQFAAHMKLASLLHEQADYQGAVQHYAAGVAEAPDDRAARFDYAQALADAGRSQESVREFQALLAQPTSDWPHVAAHAAWMRVTRGPGGAESASEAIALAQEACRRTNSQDPLPLRALAAAEAARKDFTAAAHTARLAQQQARAAGMAPLAAACASDLEKYQRQEAIRGTVPLAASGS